MTATGTSALVVSSIGTFGTEILVVITAGIGVAVAFLVLRKGISWFKRFAK